MAAAVVTWSKLSPQQQQQPAQLVPPSVCGDAPVTWKELLRTLLSQLAAGAINLAAPFIIVECTGNTHHRCTSSLVASMAACQPL